MRRASIIFLAVVAVSPLAAPAVATAANHPRLSVDVSRALGRLILRLSVEAGGRGVASPPRSIALTLPGGFGFNGGRFRSCTRALGRGHGRGGRQCDARSRLATGSARLTGYNSAAAQRRIDASAQVVVFNRGGGRVLLRFSQSSPTADEFVVTGVASGRNLFVSLPPLEMVGYVATVSYLRLSTRPGWVRVGGCPGGGSWTFGALYAYYSRSDRPSGPPTDVSRRVRCGRKR